MAKQTIKSLLGNSDEREQVELNLNPIALQSTIRSGGNYRVAVQQTPKTVAALQLFESLKQGVRVYGQAVNVAQAKAVTDVETMSDEDFDTFLNEGLDEESRNIFGYTKAYNQALAKKYYAEQMPLKLQQIASDLHSDPYRYKTPEEFEAGALEAVSGAYEEADALLGGNVFANQANNALKSVTRADFVAKQQATYLERLPAITRQLNAETAFKAISEIQDTDLVGKSLGQLLTSVSAEVGKKTSGQIVSKAYLDNIELAIANGDLDRARNLIGELDSDEEATFGMQGRRKINGIEIFNTSDNRLRLEQLEDKLEQAGVDSYNISTKNAAIASSAIFVETSRILNQEGGIEANTPKGMSYLDDIARKAEQGSVTINGVKYEDTIELAGIIQSINSIKNNKNLFIYDHKLSFIQQNTGQKDDGIRDLINYENVRSKLGNNVNIIGKPDFDHLGRQVFAYSETGLLLKSAFETELTRLKFKLHDDIAALPQSEKIDEFNKRYVEDVVVPMQNWTTQRLEQLVPPEPTVEVPTGIEATLTEDLTEIDNDTLLSASDKRKAKEIIIQEEKDRLEAMNFDVNSDGTRSLLGDVDTSKFGPFYRGSSPDPTLPYQRAIEAGQFRDSDEQSRGFNAVHRSFQSNSRKRHTALTRYYQKRRFQELSFVEMARRKARLRENFSLYGLSIQDLASDAFGTSAQYGAGYVKPVSLTEVYGDGNPFSSVPLVYNGSIQNTAKVVQDYIKDPETVLPHIFYQVADNYGISVSTMMNQMEAYLLTNNFIK